MKLMQLQLKRLDVDEFDFEVKLPPELEVFGCARTKPIEETISSSRTSPLKGVRKEKPCFGVLPVRACRKRRESRVTGPLLLPETRTDQNINTNATNCSATSIGKTMKVEAFDSDFHYDDSEPVFSDSDLVDVDVSRKMDNVEMR